MVFQNKSVSWKFHRTTAWGGLPKIPESTMERSDVPLHSQVSQLVIKRVPRRCGKCWGLTMGTLTLKEADVVPEVPSKLECPGRHRGYPKKSWLEFQEELRITIKG